MKRIILALHDVAPPFEDEIRRQIKRLEEGGIDRCVLKVVPNWHGTAPIDRYPSFVHLLRQRVERGDQIVLHGWEHRVRGRLRGPAILRLRATLFAPGVAEFLALDARAAATAIAQGQDLLQRCRLPAATTLCPPGWLLAPDLVPVLRATGIRAVTSMMVLHDLSGTSTPLPGFGYIGAGGAQEAGIRCLNVLTGSWARLPRSVTRVYLHPAARPDDAALDRVLARAIHLANRGVRPITFAELLDG